MIVAVWSVRRLRDQNVDDLPVLVNSPVHVAPHAVDFDIGPIDESPITRTMTGKAGGGGELGAG
jgi:hypothetical protein